MSLVFRSSIVLALFVFLPHTSSSQETTCAVLGSPSTRVSLGDVEPYRLPSSNELNCSAACKASADSKINEWRASDAADFERLANRFCSGLEGWVERVPGTCQAGGPPPICKVDHWKRVDPRTSFQQFREEQLKIKAARREQLIRAACKCRASELVRNDQDTLAQLAVNQGKGNAPVTAVYYGSATVPCSNGACPPGTSCNSGVCRVPTQTQQLTKKAGDMALDYAKDQLQKEALKKLSLTLFNLTESFGGTIVLRLMEPVTLSTDRDLYQSQMGYVSDDLSNLNRLYNELDDSEKGKPARGQKMVREEINETKERLTDHIQVLNIAYSAVVNQRQLHNNECYEVFEYQQQKINQAFANFMSVP